MKLGRAGRIRTLLAIDCVFFLVELIVGHLVGSLALVADSFHMLNDILSLLVALYAIKLAKRTNTSDDTRYSYGWHRAEILAALTNGVFLLALCFSVFIEAISRFFERPEVSNPKLVVIVGCVGLITSIVGLILFHEHGHVHAHSHGHSHKKTKLTEKRTSKQPTPAPSNTGTPRRPSLEQRPSARPIEADANANASADSVSGSSSTESENENERAESFYGHPVATRAAVVQAAHDIQMEARAVPAAGPSGAGAGAAVAEGYTDAVSADVDLERGECKVAASAPDLDAQSTEPRPVAPPSLPAGTLNMRALLLHVLGDALGNVGVISTGLVIWLASGSGSWRFYLDPVMSLIITAIIFTSAVPLVKSASLILLQSVPAGVSLRDVARAIRRVRGVQDVHELHVWTLAEGKLVASVHVRVRAVEPASDSVSASAANSLESVVLRGEDVLGGADALGGADVQAGRRDGNGNGNGTGAGTGDHDRAAEFMRVAAAIRRTLHERGIHSSTIQPEYADAAPPYVGVAYTDAGPAVLADEVAVTAREQAGAGTGTRVGRTSGTCLIPCPPAGSGGQECNPAENACCPPPKLVDV